MTKFINVRGCPTQPIDERFSITLQAGRPLLYELLFAEKEEYFHSTSQEFTPAEGMQPFAWWWQRQTQAMPVTWIGRWPGKPHKPSGTPVRLAGPPVCVLLFEKQVNFYLTSIVRQEFLFSKTNNS